jgi:excisionase family DNA binding protein
VKSNSPGTAPAFLTVRELATRWKSSERHIWRMIADDSLPVHRIGRLVRIALADIVLFEAASRQAA